MARAARWLAWLSPTAAAHVLSLESVGWLTLVAHPGPTISALTNHRCAGRSEKPHRPAYPLLNGAQKRDVEGTSLWTLSMSIEQVPWDTAGMNRVSRLDFESAFSTRTGPGVCVYVHNEVGATNRSVTVLVAYDPTGARVATASDDGSVKLWDTTTNGLVLQFDKHATVIPDEVGAGGTASE